MKRDKKGIKEKLVKWINKIVSKEKEKKKIRNIKIITQKMLSYKTTLISTKKLP